MISCTEFIAAYSELFKFIEQKGGKDAVITYWKHISDKGINRLGELVKAHGIRGCYMYWSSTLNEEAADFTMTLDEEAGVFTIDMHHCPSKGRLLEYTYFTPYRDYCEHCDILYRRVLEQLGYRYEYDFSGVGHAACTLRVTRPESPMGSGNVD